MNVRDVIRALGGAASIARELGLRGDGVGARTVRAWGIRQSIPAEWFSPLARLADRLGRAEINEVSLARFAEIWAAEARSKRVHKEAA